MLSMFIVYTLMYIVSKLTHTTPLVGADVLALLLPWVLMGAMFVLWLRTGRQRYAMNSAPQGEGNSAATELDMGTAN